MMQKTLYHGTSIEIAKKMALNGYFGISEAMVYERYLFYLNQTGKKYDQDYFNKIRTDKEFKVFCVTSNYQIAKGFAMGYKNPVVLEIKIPFAKDIIKKYTNNDERQIQLKCRIPKNRVVISKKFYNEQKSITINLTWQIFLLENVLCTGSVTNATITFFSTRKDILRHEKRLQKLEEWEADFGWQFK
jgi:hypothetical protein